MTFSQHSIIVVIIIDKDVLKESTTIKSETYINPLTTNRFTHHYHLGESTFNSRVIKSDFKFLISFSMEILSANRIAPDGTPLSAASHLGL